MSGMVEIEIDIFTTESGGMSRREDEENKDDWFNIILPVMGTCFLLILFFTFYKYVVVVCRKCECCRKCRMCLGDAEEGNRRNGSSENPGFDRTEEVDLPPSYSVVQHNTDVFRVVTEEDTNPVPPSFEVYLETEKLPTYLEIMEQKQREENQRTTSGTGAISNEPVAIVTTRSLTTDTSQHPGRRELPGSHLT
ncbi:unnamed protein product [Clavelina lepadiformis]|uniref:Uncharacterized protein n=1 Tax=Clavelina lepadiformis TaxID=159417 RepID=A0ABP0GJ23_CLALP